MLLYEKQVVIVTGSGSGIGRTVAIYYAKQGAKVVLWDKNPEGLEQTKLLIKKIGYHVTTKILDLTNSDEIVSAMGEVKDLFGHLDILINNAGLGKTISPYDLTIDDWDYVMNTNLRATFICSREAAKIMRYNHGGSIVNIASTRALMSEPNTEAYAASKGGILAVTHAMAISLGPDKITVNSISPGWIETGDYTRLKNTDHKLHPAGRVGKPEDVARACLYLTHPENDFITGTNIIIDGGMTRKMIYED